MEIGEILILFVLVLVAVGFAVDGVVWLFQHELPYVILFFVAVIALFLLVAYVRSDAHEPKGRTRGASTLDTARRIVAQARQAELRLSEARLVLERESRTLERLRLEKRGEIYFDILRQRHFESSLVANKWHAHTSSTQKIRRNVSSGLTQVREKKRQLARMRDGSSQARRPKIISELQQTQLFIDQIYAALSSLDGEIERGRTSRQQFNNQTGDLRDHIRDTCGQRGKLWYARLEARKSRSLTNSH